MNIKIKKDLLFSNFNINDIDWLIQNGLSPNKKNANGQNFLTYKIYNKHEEDSLKEYFIYCENNQLDILKDTLLFSKRLIPLGNNDIPNNVNVEDYKTIYQLTKKYEKELEYKLNNNSEKMYHFLKGAIHSSEKLKYLIDNDFDFSIAVKSENKQYYHVVIEKLIENNSIIPLKQFLSYLNNKNINGLEKLYFSTQEDFEEKMNSLYYELGKVFSPKEINKYLDIKKLEVSYDNYCVCYNYTDAELLPVTAYLLEHKIIKTRDLLLTEENHPEKGSVYEYITTFDEFMCLKDNGLPFHMEYLPRNKKMENENKEKIIAFIQKEKLNHSLSESSRKINKRRI